MTTSSTTTPPTTWHGWHRPPGACRWIKILDAESEDAAWADLLNRRLAGDVTVCAAGRSSRAGAGCYDHLLTRRRTVNDSIDILPALRRRAVLLRDAAAGLHAAVCAGAPVDPLTAARLLVRLDKLAHRVEDLADFVQAEAPVPDPEGAP